MTVPLKHAAQLNDIINSLYVLVLQCHDYHDPQTSKALNDEMYGRHAVGAVVSQC